MDHDPTQSPLMNVREYEAYIKRSAGFAAKQRHYKVGPKYIKYGKSVLYYKSDVDEWLKAQRHDPSTTEFERPRKKEAA